MAISQSLKHGKKVMEHSLTLLETKDMIINYVKNQKEHHKKETFYNEFRSLLIESGIEFSDKYLL